MVRFRITECHLDLRVPFVCLLTVLPLIVLYQDLLTVALGVGPDPVRANAPVAGPQVVVALRVLEGLHDVELVVVLLDVTPHQVAGVVGFTFY